MMIMMMRLLTLAHGQLMTFTVIPHGHETSGTSEGARTQPVILSESSLKYSEPDVQRIRPSQPWTADAAPSPHQAKQARSDLLGVQITETYAVASKSGPPQRESTTTESVIHFLDRIRQLPPDEKLLPPLVTSATTESVIELLNKLRQRVSSVTSGTESTSTSTASTPSPVTPTSKSVPVRTEKPTIDALPTTTATTAQFSPTFSSTIPNFSTQMSIPTTKDAVTERDAELLEQTFTVAKAEEEEKEVTTTSGATEADFELTLDNLPKDFPDVLGEVDNGLDRIKDFVPIQTELLEPLDTTTIPWNDSATSFSEESFILLEETTLSIEMDDLFTEDRNSTVVPKEFTEITQDSTVSTSTLDFPTETQDVEFIQVPTLGPRGLEVFKDMSSNTSSSGNLIQEWKVAIISSIVVLLTVLVLAVIITLCVCRNTIHRKNVYTTMETQPPQFFTQPGPPVILQHEIEAVQNPRAAFAASSQKITEL